MAPLLTRSPLRLLLPGATGFLYILPASARQANQKLKNPDSPSTLVVNVRMPDGSPLDTPAVVNLYTFSGTSAGIGVFRSATANFTNLAPASYTLTIIAAGYQRLTENVQIMTSRDHQQLSISLTPESASPTASVPPGPPILAPNAEKEITQALEELRANKSEEARRHLKKGSNPAP